MKMKEENEVLINEELLHKDIDDVTEEVAENDNDYLHPEIGPDVYYLY